MSAPAPSEPLSDEVNFDAVEAFVREARAAHARGDSITYIAARKLISVALNLSDLEGAMLHTSHLKR